MAALTRSAEERRYFYTTAEKFFLEVWRGYKLTECTPERIRNRVIRMRDLAVSRGQPKQRLGEYKKMIRQSEALSFNRFRDSFFMADLFHEHKWRFRVTYEAAEKYAQSEPD